MHPAASAGRTRMPIRRAFPPLLALVLLALPSAAAQAPSPPSVDDVLPAGGRCGETVVLAVRGGPFPPRTRLEVDGMTVAVAPAAPARATVAFPVPADASPGPRDVRLVLPDRLDGEPILAPANLPRVFGYADADGSRTLSPADAVYLVRAAPRDVKLAAPLLALQPGDVRLTPRPFAAAGTIVEDPAAEVGNRTSLFEVPPVLFLADADRSGGWTAGDRAYLDVNGNDTPDGGDLAVA
ncbi:MAG TPA: hypothetical protein VHH36_07955, partial [Candidatus Thermoplasmatota archaeon]|nr:hypothetical protein [Candidatus Thermoplasmatota archaeon]